MVTPTLVPILGSVVDGDLMKNEPENLRVVTPNGFVIVVNRQDVKTIQTIQPGAAASENLYRFFVAPDTYLSISIRADSWSALDTALDAKRAMLANSGASKKIEDTA
jgi:hypothetical protein